MFLVIFLIRMSNIKNMVSGCVRVVCLCECYANACVACEISLRIAKQFPRCRTILIFCSFEDCEFLSCMFYYLLFDTTG